MRGSHVPRKVFLGKITVFDLPSIYTWQKNVEDAILRNAKTVPKNFFSVVIWYVKILRREQGKIQYFAIRNSFLAPIGYATIKNEFDDGQETADIGIFLGKYRNLGFGSVTLDFIEKFCSRRDILRLRAIVNAENTISVNFFIKNGFKIVSEDSINKIYIKEIKATNNLD